MYDDAINYALNTRKFNMIQANERTLLSEIQFTLGRNTIKCAGTKLYSDEFLKALVEHGVVVSMPKDKDDSWIFKLPDTEEDEDD
ncbi:hypothetical protein ACT543_03695 [Lactiplantibacillus plantarum]|uniref:hypothetical protein n=1 Tax=Lactiplantibacillus plantarum TaxID=1590 RepID=UPI0040374C1B